MGTMDNQETEIVSIKAIQDKYNEENDTIFWMVIMRINPGINKD